MINTHLPRIVLVTRKTPLTLLVEHHGTLGQAQFYLKTRGQDIAEYEAAHQRFEAALALVTQCIPPDRRRIRLDRGNLDRFLFAPDDIVVIVGQDGLVPNAAKYLNGQMAIGVNPDPERYDGVLVPHRPQSVARLLAWTETCQGGEYHIQRRVMALAEREDGQRLLALNEVFIGHRSHQSARYRLRVGEQQERQSSSGVICSTGTGCTGWARSIRDQRCLPEPLPLPDQRQLAWFVREPFPSVYTATGLDHGLLDKDGGLVVDSEMGEGGVVFADGIEGDRLEFLDGHRVRVTVARMTLNLVVPGNKKAAARAGAAVKGKGKDKDKESNAGKKEHHA
jgi:hypothetical protein